MTLESVLRPRSAEMVPFGTDVRFSLTHAEQGAAVKQRPWVLDQEGFSGLGRRLLTGIKRN